MKKGISMAMTVIITISALIFIGLGIILITTEGNYDEEYPKSINQNPFPKETWNNMENTCNGFCQRLGYDKGDVGAGTLTGEVNECLCENETTGDIIRKKYPLDTTHWECIERVDISKYEPKSTNLTMQFRILDPKMYFLWGYGIETAGWSPSGVSFMDGKNNTQSLQMGRGEIVKYALYFKNATKEHTKTLIAFEIGNTWIGVNKIDSYDFPFIKMDCPKSISYEGFDQCFESAGNITVKWKQKIYFELEADYGIKPNENIKIAFYDAENNYEKMGEVQMVFEDTCKKSILVK